MNQQTRTVFLAVILLWSSAAISVGQASAPTDDLGTFLAGNASNPTVQSIQQILNLKQKLSQGNKTDLVTTLVQAAAGSLGEQKSLAALPLLASSTNNVAAVLQTAVKTELAKKLGGALAPYQDGISALSQLFGQSTLQPSIVTGQPSETLTGAPTDYSKVLAVTATAYGPGTIDNGHWGNYDYFGNPLHSGIVAVDPTVIPMGTKLWIPGYGYGVANDQGGAIKGNRVDLFFPNRQDALDYGIKNLQIYVLK